MESKNPDEILHEEKTQVNKEGVQRGVYKIDSTANDTSEGIQEKKKDTIGREFQRGWYTCKHNKQIYFSVT